MWRETTWNKQVDFVWLRYLRQLIIGWKDWCKGREWGRVNGALTASKRSENNWTHLKTTESQKQTVLKCHPPIQWLTESSLSKRVLPLGTRTPWLLVSNAPGFVSKNRGGRGTAEAERDRERINATKTYSKRSTQRKNIKKTVQCKHFIITGVASTKAILLGSVRIHDITQWFFLPPRGERANLWPKLSSEKRAGDRTGCSSCGEMECK